MTRDGTESIHKILRKARLDAGITQAALAVQVGCKQSAVSMMEAGRREAISHESLVKLAGILQVELPDSAPMQSILLSSGSGISICSNFNCPSNMPYPVGEEVYFMPLGNVGSGHHCVLCGELLSRVCPNCGGGIAAFGGCCGSCGSAIVEMPAGYADDIPAWIQARLAVIARLRQLPLTN